MRAVVQRVSEASVEIGATEIGRIGRGLLIYLGVSEGDTDKDIEYLASKISGLRIFADQHQAMNLSVTDISGSALVISQFTLLGDVRHGRRPSFVGAMAGNQAQSLYEKFTEKLASFGVPVKQGIFGAMMKIHSVNDGPVTILLDSTKLF